MATKQERANLDFGGAGGLLNAVIQNLGSAPSNPSTGLYYFDTAVGAPFAYSNVSAAWKCLDATLLVNAIPLTALVGFGAAVQAYRLDQFAVPTNPVSFGSQQITNVADPTTAQGAATKNYVDTTIQNVQTGISPKGVVTAVSTANITTLSGLPTIDGVTLSAGQIALLTAQTTTSQNGPWVVAAGAWARPTGDGHPNNDLTYGALWFVDQGTVYGATQWTLSGSGPWTPGTTAVTIVQFNAAQAYTASNGVQKSGNNFAGQVAAGGGVLVGSSGFYADTTVVAKAPYVTTFTGTGSATSFTITHNLGSQVLSASLVNTSTNNIEDAAITFPTANTAVVSFGSAPASGLVYAIRLAV